MKKHVKTGRPSRTTNTSSTLHIGANISWSCPFEAAVSIPGWESAARRGYSENDLEIMKFAYLFLNLTTWILGCSVSGRRGRKIYYLKESVGLLFTLAGVSERTWIGGPTSAITKGTRLILSQPIPPFPSCCRAWVTRDHCLHCWSLGVLLKFARCRLSNLWKERGKNLRKWGFTLGAVTFFS